jgi:hypothetical protein
MVIVVHVSVSPLPNPVCVPISDPSALYCDLGDVPKCITYDSEGFEEFPCITDASTVFTNASLRYSAVVYLYA